MPAPLLSLPDRERLECSSSNRARSRPEGNKQQQQQQRQNSTTATGTTTATTAPLFCCLPFVPLSLLLFCCCCCCCRCSWLAAYLGASCSRAHKAKSKIPTTGDGRARKRGSQEIEGRKAQQSGHRSIRQEEKV